MRFKRRKPIFLKERKGKKHKRAGTSSKSCLTCFLEKKVGAELLQQSDS
jgi:hypothetical protein